MAESTNQTPEICIVEVTVTFYKKGDAISEENHGLWLYPLSDTSSLLEGRIDKINDNMEAIIDGNTVLISENVAFDFSYAGENRDPVWSNGIEFETGNNGYQEVFGHHLPQLLEVAGRFAELATVPSDPTQPPVYRFLTLWAYSSYETEDEWKTEHNFIGVINPDKLVETTVKYPPKKDDTNDDEGTNKIISL
jgi:hypothetical protein